MIALGNRIGASATSPKMIQHVGRQAREEISASPELV